MWKKVAFLEVMLYDGLHKENIMKTTMTKLIMREIIGGVFTMKKLTGWRSCLAMCLASAMLLAPLLQTEVYAAETANVQGTVASGTTAELLMLSTKDGKMEIKIDSSTDVSEARILLPETKLSVAISHGSDGYWHATKITYNGAAVGITIDTSKTSTITGTISDKTNGDVLYVDTAQGEMQIKYDQTTNINGCSVLVANRKYNITCARGSDAYMHAISIADASNTQNNSSSSIGGTYVNGTVSGKTTSDVLFLDTKDGTMEFKVDGNADTTNGKWKTTGTKLTVWFYRGGDAYLHANRVAEGTTTGGNNSNTTGTVTNTFTGTVSGKTTESVLFLDTKDGTMEFKIDSNANTINGLVTVAGNRMTVGGYNGNDGYWHASTLTGERGSSSASVNTSATITVTGTVSGKSTEKVLFLDTNGGTMELKLDALRSVNNCKVFVVGKKLTVTCGSGNDEYWHALDITA